jgi:hypothetical protein
LERAKLPEGYHACREMGPGIPDTPKCTREPSQKFVLLELKRDGQDTKAHGVMLQSSLIVLQ